jgi:hypothetical protein
MLYGVAGLCAAAIPLTGIYPVFVMTLLCFAIFACAFNLLLGFGGMCRSDTRLSLAPLPIRPVGSWLSSTAGRAPRSPAGCSRRPRSV